MLYGQKFCDVTGVSVGTQRQIRPILDALLLLAPPTSAPGPSAPGTLPPPPAPRLPQAAAEPPLLKRKRSPEVPQVWRRVHRRMVPVCDGAEGSFPIRTGMPVVPAPSGPAAATPIRPAVRRGGGAGGGTQAVEGAPLRRQLDAGTRGSRGTGMLKGQLRVPTTALPAALRLLCACAVRSIATPCGSCAGGRPTGCTTGCTYRPASTRGGSARCFWVQACASSRRTSRTASGSSRSVRRTCRCPSTCKLLLVLSALISA